jgi:hypothetical protein
MGDDTNPGIPSLDAIPVSMKLCDRRSEKIAERFDRKTDEIAKVITDKHKVLDRVTRDLEIIKARQNGKRSTMEDIWRSGSFWLRLVGTLILLGGVVWGAAKLAQPPPEKAIDYERLAKTVAKAVKEP